MSDNKSGKYLRYALGEIILVVIGILIALQVNNWNNENAERDKERYYLNSIKQGIELSQNELSRVIDDARYIAEGADTLLQRLAFERYDRLDDIALDTLLLAANDYSLISLNDGGVREILNTGELNIIQNDTIRVILASWEERLHKIRKFEDESQYLSRLYNRHIEQYMDISRLLLEENSSVIPQKRNQLLEDPQLRNYLFQITIVHNGMYERYTEERDLLDSLNTMIDHHLQQ